MADIILAVSAIFTAAMNWAAMVGTTVTSTPILLIFVIMPLVGLGVGLFRRLLGN